MTPDRSVRFARQPEAGAVVDLIRSSFPERVIERTIYGCSGVVPYVRALTGGSPYLSPRHLVAVRAAEVVAAAELAVAGSDLFLSYIATRAVLRTHGFGTSLLAAAVRHGLDAGLKTMTLDVFVENARARSWYQAFGFSPVEERGWWEVPTVATTQSLGSVSGWPQAEVCQSAFGFSEIVIWTANGLSRVGRLGLDWFRAPSLSTLLDDQMIGTLHEIDPRRRILVMGPIDRSSSETEPLLRLIRLRAVLSDLTERMGRI